MFKKCIEISGQTLTIETGRMAKQASGSVLVTYGETVVLVASTANQGIEPNRGFFPLTIDYREKFYASFRQYCFDQKAIAEFYRYNPINGNHLFSERFVELFKNRQTVALNLDQS